MNPAELNLFGYKQEEIKKIQPDQLYVDPDDRKPFLAQIKNKKSLKEYELKLKNKRGDTLYCLETTNTMVDKNGNIIGIQGIIRDITGRKRAEAAACKDPQTKGTILIIEDDAAILQIAKRAIEACGYRVLTVASSAAADEMLAARDENVDLALLDVLLSGIHGYHLFKSWREKYPRLRVLFMSGYMDDVGVIHDILAQGLPFIQKPLTAESLVLTIKKVLGEKHHD